MSLPTLPPKQSALPDSWVDRIFAELLAMYGKHWLDLWAGCDIGLVKGSWGAALHGLDGEAIRLALDALRAQGKPFPPTQPEFVSLCRQSVRHGSHRLRLAAPRYEPPENIFAKLKRELKV